MYVKIALLVFVVVSFAAVGFRSCYYEKQFEEATQRAEKAENDLAVLRVEREKLELALEDQQRATVEAQMNKKVVYKTIQKEVQTDATARDWYNAPVPAGFVRLLKDNASAR